MLIYEKWTTESDERVRHLYGTVNNVPSDSDNLLVYQDADGDTVTPSLSYTFLDDGHGGINMFHEDDGELIETFLAVNIKKQDNSLVNIVPGGSYEPATKTLKSISFKKKPTTTTYTAGDPLDLTGTKIEAVFETGDKEIVGDFTGAEPVVAEGLTFSPANEATLTVEDTTLTASYTVGSVNKTATCTLTVSNDK